MSIRDEASLQSCGDGQATDLQEGTPTLSFAIQGVAPDHTDEQDPDLVIPPPEDPIDEDEFDSDDDSDDDDWIPKGQSGAPTTGPSTKTQDAKKPAIERPPQEALKKPTIERPSKSTPPPKK